MENIRFLIILLSMPFLLKAAEVKERYEAKAQQQPAIDFGQPLHMTKLQCILSKNEVVIPTKVQDLILQYYQDGTKSHAVHLAHDSVVMYLLEIDPNTLASVSLSFGNKVRLFKQVDGKWVADQVLVHDRATDMIMKLQDGCLASADWLGNVYIWQLRDNVWTRAQVFAGSKKLVQLKSGTLVASYEKVVEFFEKDAADQFQKVSEWSNGDDVESVTALTDDRVAVELKKEIIILEKGALGLYSAVLKIPLKSFDGSFNNLISLAYNQLAVRTGSSEITIVKIAKDKYEIVQKLTTNSRSWGNAPFFMCKLGNNRFATDTNTPGHFLNIFAQDKEGKWHISNKIRYQSYSEMIRNAIELSDGRLALAVDRDIRIIPEDVVLSDPITKEEKKALEDKHCVIQ